MPLFDQSINFLDTYIRSVNNELNIDIDRKNRVPNISADNMHLILKLKLSITFLAGQRVEKTDQWF